METLQLTDFFKYRYPSALELSPDGKRLAFAVKEVDPEADGYRWGLWLCELSAGGCRPLTGGEGLRRPVWEDDGHLLIWEQQPDEELRKRGVEASRTRLSRLDVISGEKTALAAVPLPVTAAWPLGDGRYLLTAETRLGEPNLLELEGAAREQEIARRLHARGYQVLTELPLCENGVGIVNRMRNSLFLLERDGGLTAVTPPHWDVNHVNVSGGRVVFTAFPFRDVKPVTEGVYRWAPGGEIETIIPPDRYSVDYAGFYGDQVLCLGLVMKDFGVYEHPTFFLADGGEIVDLGRYDRRVNSEVVTDSFDGRVTGQRMVDRALYFLNTDGVGVQLCRWTREEGVVPLRGGDDYLIDFDTRDGKSFVLVAAAGLGLPEVYLWQEDGMRRLTHLNDGVLEGKTLSVPEAFTFRDRDGVEVDGFVLKPVGYRPGGSYPGILHIHGGPKMVFGPGFHHEMQLWAARGYFVCYCNPRGSCGKGNAFADLQGKYGTVDFNDLMDFTDEVIRRYPDLDAGRMGVCGGSYGGFMTNWVIGHTDRFRCAVSQRSIANYVGDYLLSDIGYYYVPDQQLGTVWDHPERLWEASPLTYADRVRTPTLFIHSDKDYRCTLANGLEMFAALKLHGVETRLCMFYGEDHGLSRTGKPSNRICRMEEILAWLDGHLKEGDAHESA